MEYDFAFGILLVVVSSGTAIIGGCCTDGRRLWSKRHVL